MLPYCRVAQLVAAKAVTVVRVFSPWFRLPAPDLTPQTKDESETPAAVVMCALIKAALFALAQALPAPAVVC
jgi:hypothetical protein